LFFSDDVAWCKENLESKGCEMNFVQECINLTLLEEFYLLSLLDKAIISNSTFSLFAACLGNKDKTVVFPTHWFIDGREAQKKFPKKWIRSAVF
jgi:hypothetical protein